LLEFKRMTTAKSCEYELLITSYFFGIIDLLGLAALGVIFLYDAKSFHFVTKYLCYLFLLLYIFGYLFGLRLFGVYIYFHLVSEQVHSIWINFLSVILDSFSLCLFLLIIVLHLMDLIMVIENPT